MELPAADVALLALGLLAVLGVVALALRWAARVRRDDAALVAEVARCFGEVSRRQGLAVEPVAPASHPVVGAVAVAPRLRGTLAGFDVTLAVEGDPSGEDVWLTVLRVSNAVPHMDWPTLRFGSTRELDAASLPPRAVPEARDLLAVASRVTASPRELVAELKAPQRVDWSGRERRVTTDPAHVDAALERAVRLAAQLTSA